MVAPINDKVIDPKQVLQADRLGITVLLCQVNKSKTKEDRMEEHGHALCDRNPASLV